MAMYTSSTRRLVKRKGNMKVKSQPLLTAQNVKRVGPTTAAAVRIVACRTTVSRVVEAATAMLRL
uniref:Transmembrane BAX inhibitor motif-containing protein 4 n=1 Tax=Arundo donax TaxID=35708 RepID=A0A0A9H3Q6_ARUDO